MPVGPRFVSVAAQLGSAAFGENRKDPIPSVKPMGPKSDNNGGSKSDINLVGQIWMYVDCWSITKTMCAYFAG